MQVANLIRDADQAIAGRDYGRAASLLEQAASQSPSDMGLWMRVAAMRRGPGELDRALDAVHKALAINPLEFMALLMRASLLQKLGHPEAGEAWGHALAQKPDHKLPDQFAPIVAEAEERY